MGHSAIFGGNIMNNKEEVRSQVGVYNLPKGTSDAGEKVMALFTKLKSRAKEMEVKGSEPNLAEIQQAALQGYQSQDNVVKSDEGFQVA